MPEQWGHLTTRDFASLEGCRAVAAVVLGATEQHGPHLPVATDCIIGKGLLAAAAQRLDDDFPLVVLPTLAVGASDEHAGFAGTLSLPPDQTRAQIAAIGEGLVRAGLERLVMVNAHGGNVGWLEDSALDLRRRFGLLAVKASYMRFEAPTGLLGADELRDGLHGGLAETAMMRHLAPELVRMDQAEHFRTRQPHDGSLPPQGEAPWAWLAEDLHAAGVVGDAASATPALGQRLVAHYAGTLAEVITACREKPWPPSDSP